MNYSWVTWEDRIKIKLLLEQEKSDTEISVEIGKNKSTVGREVKRNSGGRGYRPMQAQYFAESREKLKHQPYVLSKSSTYPAFSI
jgi:IS30 family transposase